MQQIPSGWAALERSERILRRIAWVIGLALLVVLEVWGGVISRGLLDVLEVWR